MYAQADLRLCWSHIPHCWKSHVKVYVFLQLLKCLATDRCMTADQGVASSIPAWSHTFAEIDHEIIYTFLLPSADSRTQLQMKVCARSTG